MKTIEEASKDYAKTNVDQCVNATIDSLKEYAYQDFKAGVEFAQRWIHIEEELPEYYESVLMNFSGGSETFLVWRAFSPEYEKDIYTISGTNRIVKLKPINWRPVEYK